MFCFNPIRSKELANSILGSAKYFTKWPPLLGLVATLLRRGRFAISALLAGAVWNLFEVRVISAGKEGKRPLPTNVRESGFICTNLPFDKIAKWRKMVVLMEPEILHHEEIPSWKAYLTYPLEVSV